MDRTISVINYVAHADELKCVDIIKILNTTHNKANTFVTQDSERIFEKCSNDVQPTRMLQRMVLSYINSVLNPRKRD